MLFELFVATMAVNLKTCFETFCRDFGLEHQFSSPCVACQNGVVERKNRSLLKDRYGEPERGGVNGSR
jgi:transposase InsO family protein